MADIIRTPGIRDKIMENIHELNGFHEVTERVYDHITQPEWREILSKYYPNLPMDGRNIHVDLKNEIIRLE